MKESHAKMLTGKATTATQTTSKSKYGLVNLNPLDTSSRKGQLVSYGFVDRIRPPHEKASTYREAVFQIAS